MFYSQFILAKKGPLGTIWIAAHLERKLRKNQVADTDIGVSVDSILFPDVPIALRLSSHLLLGVVRIYSRKVNYLFDDCSEALLKIKQAFRSTAVDLPPEESTAPYHSITLPETFDLDDFELPDSDMFQGNYVDHHISSREQITLQDTMEGVVYSTSQFGPDERFGDGDTSGLDLDEELFLDKVAAVGEAGLILGSDAGIRASARPITPVKQAENHVAMNENSETMLASADVNQIAGGDEDTDFAEYAQAPCTPGLMEEPNLSTVQETSACDDHMETENHNSAEFSLKESHVENACNSKSDLQHENQNVVDSDDLESSYQLKQPLNDMNTVPRHMPARDNNDDLKSSQLKQQQPGRSPPLTIMDQIASENNNPYSPNADRGRRASGAPPELSSYKIIAAALDDGPEKVEVLVSGTGNNERSVEGRTDEEPQQSINMLGESTLPDMSTTSTGTCQPPVLDVSLEDNNQEEPLTTIQEVSSNNVVTAGTESNLESDDRLGNESKDSEIIMKSCSDDVHVLLPCTKRTHLNQLHQSEGDDHLDLPFEEVAFALRSKESSAAREEGVHVPGGAYPAVEVAADISKHVLEENHNTRPDDSCEGIQERSISRSNDQVDQVLGDGFLLGKKLNSSTCSDFPAPEKLLSVPEGRADVENNNFLMEEATPDKEEAVMEFDRAGAVSESVSGKKRSFTESSLTVQSLYSAESLGVQHTKGTVESVPDDNDLLSSILVGRRSSVMKVKSTPTETTSMKRHRSAPRTSTSKRKVLMDDSMVLHGDTIRQQLTNTEDIRRVRKKAPCTRPEISMIQKQFWEDEIFSEPVLTGVSTELASLHNQTYDLSEIRVSQCDVNDASFEVAADLKLIFSSEEEIVKEAVNDDTGGMSFRPDVTKETGIIDGSSDPMIVRDAEVQVQFTDDILMLTENQQCEDQTLSSEMYATTQVQMNVTSGEAEPKSSSQHEHLGESAEMENNGKCISDATVAAVNPDDTVAVELAASVGRNGEAWASLHVDESGVLPDQISDMVVIEASMLDTNSLHSGIDANDIAAVDKIADDEAAGGKNDDEIIGGVDKIDANETEGKNGDEIAAIVENESDRAKDELLLEETELRSDIQPVANPSSPEIVTVDHQVMDEEIWKNGQEDIVNEDDTILDAQVEYNNANGSAVTNGIWGGEQYSSNPAAELNMDLRNTSDDGQREVAYPPFMTEEAEVSATDLLQHHHDDFDYSTAGHDTEFLNVDDDDEEAEVDGDSMPSAEETRFLENSGWSSRTRAVANYLQTLFEKEAERGRKVLPIDNLLAGKTRKEASRMFFEALVLKTKDYIHVEQKTPFDNVNIFPRLKLLKSDF